MEISPPTPVLEIQWDWQEFSGRMHGETLYFRLYDDGTAEYEVPNGDESSKGVKPAAVLRKIVLNEREKDTSLGELKALSNVQFGPEYRNKCCCTDTQVDFRVLIDIDGTQRSTRLAGFCDASDLITERTPPVHNVPPELVKLLSTVDNLKAKYNYIQNQLR